MVIKVDSEAKLLLKLTALTVIIFAFFMNCNDVAEHYRTKDMNLSQQIHELNKMGIPYEKDCE